MLHCQEQDAILNQKFWFRTDIFDNADKSKYHQNNLSESNFTQSLGSEIMTPEKIMNQLNIW